jgi:hypothetical protein
MSWQSRNHQLQIRVIRCAMCHAVAKASGGENGGRDQGMFFSRRYDLARVPHLESSRRSCRTSHLALETEN